MNKCRKATYLLSKQQDGRLSAREHAFLKTHLLLCPHCRAYRNQLDTIKKALDKLF